MASIINIQIDEKEQAQQENIQQMLSRQGIKIQQNIKENVSKHLQEYIKFMPFPNNKQASISKLFQAGINYSKKQEQYTEFELIEVNRSKNNQIIILSVKMGPFSQQIRILNVVGSSEIHDKNCCFSFGTFSSVYQSRIHDGQIIVIKCIKLNKEIQKRKNELALAIREFFMFRIASVLQLAPKIRDNTFDLIVFKDCVEFQMEYCPPSSPDHSDHKDGLFECLKTLHNLNIVHSDIKPNNIGYSKFFQKWIFIDFGLSTILKEPIGNTQFTSFRGSLSYCSLEMQKIYQQKESYIDLYWNDVASLLNSLNKKKGHNDVQLSSLFNLPEKFIDMERILISTKYCIYFSCYLQLESMLQKIDLNLKKQFLIFFDQVPYSQNLKEIYHKILKKFEMVGLQIHEISMKFQGWRSLKIKNKQQLIQEQIDKKKKIFESRNLSFQLDIKDKGKMMFQKFKKYAFIQTQTHMKYPRREKRQSPSVIQNIKKRLLFSEKTTKMPFIQYGQCVLQFVNFRRKRESIPLCDKMAVCAIFNETTQNTPPEKPSFNSIEKFIRYLFQFCITEIKSFKNRRLVCEVYINLVMIDRATIDDLQRIYSVILQAKSLQEIINLYYEIMDAEEWVKANVLSKEVYSSQIVETAKAKVYGYILKTACQSYQNLLNVEEKQFYQHYIRCRWYQIYQDYRRPIMDKIKKELNINKRQYQSSTDYQDLINNYHLNDYFKHAIDKLTQIPNLWRMTMLNLISNSDLNNFRAVAQHFQKIIDCPVISNRYEPVIMSICIGMVKQKPIKKQQLITLFDSITQKSGNLPNQRMMDFAFFLGNVNLFQIENLSNSDRKFLLNCIDKLIIDVGDKFSKEDIYAKMLSVNPESAYFYLLTLLKYQRNHEVELILSFYDEKTEQMRVQCQICYQKYRHRRLYFMNIFLYPKNYKSLVTFKEQAKKFPQQLKLQGQNIRINKQIIQSAPANLKKQYLMDLHISIKYQNFGEKFYLLPYDGWSETFANTLIMLLESNQKEQLMGLLNQMAKYILENFTKYQFINFIKLLTFLREELQGSNSKNDWLKLRSYLLDFDEEIWRQPFNAFFEMIVLMMDHHFSIKYQPEQRKNYLFLKIARKMNYLPQIAKMSIRVNYYLHFLSKFGPNFCQRKQLYEFKNYHKAALLYFQNFDCRWASFDSPDQKRVRFYVSNYSLRRSAQMKVKEFGKFLRKKYCRFSLLGAEKSSVFTVQIFKRRLRPDRQ